MDVRYPLVSGHEPLRRRESAFVDEPVVARILPGSVQEAVDTPSIADRICDENRPEEWPPEKAHEENEPIEGVVLAGIDVRVHAVSVAGNS